MIRRWWCATFHTGVSLCGQDTYECPTCLLRWPSVMAPEKQPVKVDGAAEAVSLSVEA